MCAICDGPLFLLGILGNRAWLRCRNCALDTSILASEIDEIDASLDGDADPPDIWAREYHGVGL